jgi:hypothetical protein
MGGGNMRSAMAKAKKDKLLGIVVLDSVSVRIDMRRSLPLDSLRGCLRRYHGERPSDYMLKAQIIEEKI